MYLPLLFSIIVGLLSITPHFLAVRAIGSEYQGVPFLFNDDEDTYLGRIQEIIDGHPSVASPAFYEYKNWPVLLPPVNEYVYAAPTLLFGVSPEKTLLVAKFLGPALLFFLVYWLTFLLIEGSEEKGRKLTAIATALLVTLGYDFVDFKYAWSVLLGSHAGTSLSVWTRPVNPIMGAILLYSLLILVWRVIKKQSIYSLVLAGIILGGMVGYFFSWGVGVAFVGTLFILFLGRSEIKLAKKVGYICLVSFLTSLPFWINTLKQVLSSSDGRELAARNGMYFNHIPIFNKFNAAAIILFLLFSWYFFYRQKEIKSLTTSHWWLFSLSLLVSGVVVFNQQVITGRTIWPYHFVQYTIGMGMVAIMVCGFYCLRPFFPRLWSVMMIMIVGLCLVYGGISARTYVYKLNDFREFQTNKPLFSWLKSKAGAECVVLVNEDSLDTVTRRVPAFTQCDTYTAPWVFAGVPSDRIYYNYLIKLRLQTVDPQTIRAYLDNNPAQIRSNFFANWDQRFKRVSDDWQEPIKEQITKDYPEFAKKDFAEVLRKYRLDYVVSRTVLPEKEFSPKFFKLLEVTGEWYIYQFKQNW